MKVSVTLGRTGMKRVLAALLVVGLYACTPASPTIDDPQSAALASVSGAAIRSHIEVLASDDMQGREAGTAGYRKAADYLVHRFADLSLEPLGNGGSYLQHVDFFETRLVPTSASMVLRRGEIEAALEFGTDFVRSGGFGARDESVTAPLLFVGFGIRAPEYDHDDFLGVDAGGKILVEFTGAPSHFASDERAFYSSGTGKRALAHEHGAVGIVTIRTPVDQKRLPWSRYLSRVGSPGMRWLEPDGTPHGGFPTLVGNAILSESGAIQLFNLAERDLKVLTAHHVAGKTGSFEFGVSATLKRHSKQRRISSPNVVGLLSGSDKRLRNEYVIYTAHLDHLGISSGLDGDDINNGAYDNAAGVATILEVAAALARMSTSPRRSIIFAAVTAEEKGLQGSEYLAHNPPVPIDNIVANINIDMPYLGFPLADVEGFGVEHSTLHDALTRVTVDLGVTLTPDPRPELVRFIRSDQFSFVKQGVPGLNLKPGSMSSDPAIDGPHLRNTFLQQHYHQPTDDLDLPFSEEGAERFVRVALMLGLVVANDDDAPRWKGGDFFGDRFARSVADQDRQR